MTIDVKIPKKKKKTIEILEQKDIEKIFEDAGKKEFPIKVSVQAAKFLNFTNAQIDWDDFVNWWVDNYAVVGGSHVLRYLLVKHKIDLGA